MYTVREITLMFDLPNAVHPSVFPQNAKSPFHLRTILDGELMLDDKNLDSTWSKSHKHPIFLVFDGLVVNGTNLMPLNFSNRLR